MLSLVVAFFVCTEMEGQNDYAYRKGKSYANVPATRLPDAIDLSAELQSLVYQNAVPEGVHTLACPLFLPKYVRGVFFSRDSRLGDYEWPNNTNRLLPWCFSELKELTETGYPGIPSNAAPSNIGDGLLLQQVDGKYLFVKAVSGNNSLSWLKVKTTGEVELWVSTLGTDELPSSVPLLLVNKADDPYQCIREVYHALIADSNVADLRARKDKEYFEAFGYLGWCTWEHYHFDIDERKILDDLDAIERSGIPIRYVLIDDGHLVHEHRKLASFLPDSLKFPSGWANIMARKRKDGIRWMGLWYALSGYWMGVSRQNCFSEEVKRTLYAYQDCLLPGPDSVSIRSFYREYVGTLKRQGFDFLKVDNQSFTLPLYMGSTGSVRHAVECNRSLEAEAHEQRMGLMNCMAHNVINTDHTRYSNCTRVSIDYKKYDENMAKSHLYQSYTHTLLLGQSVWPDHDMFHSCDTICGGLMARSKAMSGGPVYLSDSPNDFVAEHILPLIDEDGKVFRPEVPAVPMPGSILTNPFRSGKAYSVFAPVANDAMTLIHYNLNVEPCHRKITASIKKSDYELRMRFEQGPSKSKLSDTGQRLLLYDWESRTAQVLDEEGVECSLDGFTDRMYHLCPIRKGWAVVGIQEKYLSPATVRIVSCTENQLVLKVLCPGTLRVWIEKDGRQTLESLYVAVPRNVVFTK